MNESRHLGVSTSPRRSRPAGVLVLGMHRSGTSVVTGVLDALGLDGGDPTTMFGADEFNSDGYWEQQPIVELHDRLLRELRGFASAPPDPASSIPGTVVHGATADIDAFLSQFTGPWFVKDPRQCLLMRAWEPSLGPDDVAVVVHRDPNHVVRSLRHRNGYSQDLAAGLWEIYTSSLLRALDGRTCLFVEYDELLDRPAEVIDELAAGLASTVLAGPTGAAGTIPAERLSAARGLVRPRNRASSSTATPVTESLRPEQVRLHDVVRGLRGLHEPFVTPPLPSLAPAGLRATARRRRRLRVADSILRRGATGRAKLDRRARFVAR
ncbi:MAG: hypothetical protein AAFP84_04380 [Actinomycetota bacterium]